MRVIQGHPLLLLSVRVLLLLPELCSMRNRVHTANHALNQCSVFLFILIYYFYYSNIEL